MHPASNNAYPTAVHAVTVTAAAPVAVHVSALASNPVDVAVQEIHAAGLAEFKAHPAMHEATATVAVVAFVKLLTVQVLALVSFPVIVPPATQLTQ